MSVVFNVIVIMGAFLWFLKLFVILGLIADIFKSNEEENEDNNHRHLTSTEASLHPISVYYV